MRVLITGGAGFLGRAFLSYHMARSDEVIAIDNLSSTGSFWLPELTYHRVSIDAGEYLDNYSDGHIDLAYHFASPVGGRTKIENDPAYNFDAVRLDASFFRWAIRNHIRRLVYPSSSAVYGVGLQGPVGQQLQEGMFHPENPNWFKPDEFYGLSKLVGENLAYIAAQKYGVNTLVIRPFSGYGPGQSMDYPVPSLAMRAKRKEDPLVIWGSGDQRRDFIYIDDIVGATVSRLYKPLVGYEVMNIGSGFPTSFRNVALALANLIGYQPQITSDTTKPEGVKSRWCDNQRMLRVWTPVMPLQEGLRHVVEALPDA